jgi:hypothetical protein
MMAKPDESVEDFIDRLEGEGAITDQAATEIRAFSRFLAEIDGWDEVDGVTQVPAAWWPYVQGTGPAPDA